MTPDAFTESLRKFLLESVPRRAERASIVATIVYKLALMLAEDVQRRDDVPQSVEILSEHLLATARQSQVDTDALGALFYALRTFLIEKNGE